jgi:hypothetical protein
VELGRRRWGGEELVELELGVGTEEEVGARRWGRRNWWNWEWDGGGNWRTELGGRREVVEAGVEAEEEVEEEKVAQGTGSGGTGPPDPGPVGPSGPAGPAGPEDPEDSHPRNIPLIWIRRNIPLTGTGNRTTHTR